MRALVVEDDAKLADILTHILQRDGYEAEAVADGATGVEYAASGLYDVVVLDVMLPQVNGFDAVRTLRSQGVATPVLMLTALGTVPDKIEGLDGGADAYMTKPFSPQELLARIRALTRRQAPEAPEVLQTGDLTLDAGSYQLACGAESMPLSGQEFAVAQLFLRNAGRTLTRAQIASGAWGDEAHVEDNSIDAYVSMLRKKLRYLGSAAQIVNERGVGYRLTQEEPSPPSSS